MDGIKFPKAFRKIPSLHAGIDCTEFYIETPHARGQPTVGTSLGRLLNCWYQSLLLHTLTLFLIYTAEA